MSTEVHNLSPYIQQQEVNRQKLLNEIESWDEKIKERIQDKEKKSSEMQQNLVMVAALILQFSQSRDSVTNEIKLRYEQKIKQFYDVIEEQQKVIDRYSVHDIPTLEKNKSQAQAELAEVEAKIKDMKAIEKLVSTPIDTSGLDLSTLENQRTFKP